MSEYLQKSSPDKIKLTVENLTSTKTYYYTIGLSALTDTGWVSLLGDIDSFGQNDFISILPIRGNKKVVKYISKENVLFMYSYYKPKKIRFQLSYFEKQDFKSNHEAIISKEF